MNRCLTMGMVAAALLLSSVSAEAGFCGKRKCKKDHCTTTSDECADVSVGYYGSGCGPSISYEYVTETKLVDVVEYVKVEKEREVTIRTPVYTPGKKTVKVYQRIEEMVDVPVKKAVWSDSEVTKTRVVCRRVPVTEVKTVTVNTGHWGYESVAVGCGVSCDPCDPCGSSVQTVCRKVWIPSCEEREISCVRYETVREEIPYTVKVRTCSYEDAVVPVKKVRYEWQDKEIDVKVLTYDEKKEMQKYYVCERQVVQKEITVCRRVPVITGDCYGDSGCGEVVVGSDCCN